MEITVSQTEGRVPVTIFKVKGDIDVTSYEQLQAQAQQAAEAGTKNLILDLSAVPYVSSAGVRAINTIFNLLRRNAPEESDAAVAQGLRDGSFKSAHLKLLNPTRRVVEVLSMTGLDMLVEIHKDLKSAVAAF
jgi:anti-anti-sigma factor